MRRELRRFVADQWTVLDVPADVAVSLQCEWQRRFGHLPSSAAVRGYTFRIPQARAAYVLGEPAPEALARSLTLLCAKFGTDVRQADDAALPRIPRQLRIAPELVDQFPSGEPLLDEPVVLEYLDSGLLVSSHRRHWDWIAPTPYVEEALVFRSSQSAELWRVSNAPLERLTARYLTAARAESELRNAPQAAW